MRVFISHGLCKKDKGDLAFLRALAKALGAPTPRGVTHEVLVDDQRLEPGVQWENVLYDCLDECDAAVLVLTERALGRPWVKKEATILSFRERRRSGMALYPVARGVDAQRLAQDADWAALDLGRLQMFGAAATAAQVAAHVHARLDAQPQPGRTQLERVAGAIAAQLGGADGGQLDALCRELSAPLAFDAGSDVQRRRGMGLARAIVGGRLGAGGLSGLLRRLRSECAVAPAALDAIRDLAAPLWVDSEAANALALHCDEVAAGGPHHAAALFAAKPGYSGRMVAHRQLLPDLPLPGLDVVLRLPGDHAGGGPDEIEAALLAQFAAPRGQLPPDEARELLVDPVETFYVLLPAPVPPAEDLAELRARYPKLVFIAHAGAATRDELAASVLPLPPLDGAAEALNFKQYVATGGTRPAP